MLLVKPIFILGKNPIFKKKGIFGFVKITKKREQERKIREILEKSEENLEKAKILKPIMIREKEDFEKLMLMNTQLEEIDVFLIFKKCLGFGIEIAKLAEKGKPIIIFQEQDTPNLAFDAIEYTANKREVFAALSFKDINETLKFLEVKKKMENTKILILCSDFPFYHERIKPKSANSKTIESKLGVKLEEVTYEEFLEKWNSVSQRKAKALAKEWVSKAEKVIEPTENDVLLVARLYLAIKSMLKERKANALTLIYGESPFPVPCLAYTYLRDEGIPAACEGDVNSLLMMILLHYLAEKPAFMGNTVLADIKNNIIAVSHCVVPTKMRGYLSEPLPYILRSYHGLKFRGSVTAYCQLEKGRKVTIARFNNNLTKIFVCTGKILSCKDYEDPQLCRAVVKIKVKSVRDFLNKTFGNHHVVVYGNYVRELRKIGDLLDIEVIEA